MEAKECKVQDILTENKRFVIPPYQRPYSWTPDNAYQLVEDIYQSFISSEKEYFIGSMICINKGDNLYEVVDGQQRLTTLNIIVSELKTLITHQGVKDDLQKRILPIDVYSDEADEPRLLVREKERELFKFYLLQGKKEYKPEKPTSTQLLFIDNSTAIKEFLVKFDEVTLKGFAKYILQNVFVVFVQTNDIASSFRLFNVLNNRGLPLGNADLLKNTLFEYASSNNKDAVQIENAWSQIEDLVGVSRIDKFLSLHKLSEKLDRDRVLEKGLESFIFNLNEEYGGDPVEFALMLVGSAKNFTKIEDVDFEHPGIRRRIFSLRNLNTDEWLPPLLAFLNRMTRKESLELSQFADFLEAFEKVYMHGWLKKQVKSQREKVCYSALVAINNNLDFSDIINHVLQHADNEGVKAALDEDLYEPRPNQVNLIKAILLRADVEQQDESVLKTYTGRITIEHIVPQKLANQYWKDRFDTEQHALWLHKLGNLTLISGSKNSEAQNSDFIKKKTIYEKLNNRSSFDITRDLCREDDWNLERLKTRHQRLKQLIEAVWLIDNK